MHSRYALTTALALFACSGAWALPGSPPSLEALVQSADAIVFARARERESIWVDGNLLTRYKFAVEEDLLHGTLREVSVIVEGGVDVNRPIPVAVIVPHAPLFAREQRVALILRRTGFPHKQDFVIAGDSRGAISLADPTPASRQSPAPVGTREQVQARLQSIINSSNINSRSSPPQAPDGRRDAGNRTSVGGAPHIKEAP